jgi:hypothetical protein
MNTLTTKEKQDIKTVADEHFDGNIELASAAHVHTLGVVKRVGSQIAPWFEHEAIKAVESQMTKYLDNKLKKVRLAKKVKK